jgi:Leucine-rich repeat (LRR) protein
MRVRIFGALSLSLLFVITFSVALVTTGLAQPPDETPVTFLDANLEASIREAIDKPEGLIFTSDLDGLTSLEASGKIGELGEEITDLTGLEYCINLTELNLAWNQITYISPLASLTKLTALDLSRSQIRDISPLYSLTNLTYLSLGWNQISDISPLQNLTKLTVLILYWNEISDIPLTNLTDLTDLRLGGNEISDISPLHSLTNLTYLSLGWNQISDISPLQNLTKLTELHLEGNQIANVSPLVENTGLGKEDKLLLLRGNPLSDTSLNVYIPQLKKRGVSIPREKTALGVGRGEFLLIPLFAFIAAMVITLCFYPIHGKRWRWRVKTGLIVGVVLTGLYTLWTTFAFTFDVAYLEDLIFWVWIPGLFLYGIMVLVVIIFRKKA